jgi:hypothetical protein
LRDFITAAHAAARAVALAEEDGVTAPGTGVSGVATPGPGVDPTHGGDGLAGARSSGPTPDLFDWQSEQ